MRVNQAGGFCRRLTVCANDLQVMSRSAPPVASRRPQVGVRGWIVILALLAVGAVTPVILTLAQNSSAPKPVSPGSLWPHLGAVKAVSPVNGPKASEFVPFDLDQVMEGKILILVYWLPGDDNSQENLKAVVDWAESRDPFTVVSIVPPRGHSAGQVAEMAASLGIHVPIIWDGTYRLQRTLQAKSAPFIAVIDRQRILRLAGGASLKHKIRGDTTLEAYLEQGLAGEGLATIGQVPRYYPVTQFIDGPYMDFALSEVNSGKTVRFSDHITPGKLTLLVFWSADCGHCKIEMPLINDYFRKHKDGLNIVGVVKTANAGIRQRTKDFIRLNDLQFPTLADTDFKVFKKYRVRTTPTTVVIGPDGVVSTVLLGSRVDLDGELGPRLAAVKKTADTGV
ncbi:MAG: redoxin domain-containing protein [Acidobacteriota bacterium]